MKCALIAAVVAAIPTIASADTFEDAKKTAIDISIVYYSAIACGIDPPDTLRHISFLMMVGSFGNASKDAVDYVEDGVRKRLSELDSDRRDQYCGGAFAKVRKFRDLL